MYKAHIPTEQYGFVEVEAETPEEIFAKYLEVARLFQEGDGINDREWSSIRNRCYKEISKEDWELVLEKGSRQQKWFINQIKLAQKNGRN